MFSSFLGLTWLDSIFNTSGAARRRSSHTGRVSGRPVLEQLEDRTVPSLTSLGSELQIGSPAIYDVPPAAAIDGAGNSVVVWANGAIMGRRYDAAGTAQGPAFVIQPQPNPASPQNSPGVAMDAAGNYVVTWLNTYTDTVVARRFDAAGIQQGADVIANGPDLGATAPSVVETPAGFAVFWGMGDDTIHGGRYDAAGNLLGTITIAEAQTVNQPRAAVDAAGNFVIAYETSTYGSGGSVLGQLIDAAGAGVGGAFTLSITTGTANLDPGVAMQPDGDFAAVWSNGGDTAGAADSAPGVYVRFFNADATPKANSINVGSPTLQDSPIPSIAVDGSGDAIVTWADGSASTATIKAQLFNADGVAESVAFQVNQNPATGTYGDFVPTVATDAASSVVLIAFSNFSTTPAQVTGDLFATGPNHAPVVNTAASPAFTFVKENNANPPGDTVSSVFAPAISDQDLGAFQGVAVTGLTGAANGAWQYSLDAGATWTGFGAVAENAAFLLGGTDMIRFVPNADFLGSATLNFHAWDQTSGAVGTTVDLTATGVTGGTTAFSDAEGTATVSVTVNGNYAPVLDATYPAALSDIAVNATAPAGNTVAQIVGTSITDRNAGDPQGIAVTALTGQANGVWQYSLDAGATWTPIGNVATSAALLLQASDMVRFVPITEFTGVATISYHAWDQTQGTVGATADLTNLDPVGGAYSVAQATATATVTRFILTGNVLDVYGTPDDDTFSFVPGTTSLVTLNGETHQYSAYNGVQNPPQSPLFGSIIVNFHGDGGIDTANVDMRTTAFINGLIGTWGTTSIGDGFATLTKGNYQNTEHTAWFYTVNLSNVDKIFISGAVGDLVTMTGSTAGVNDYVSTPTYSYLVGPHNQFYVVSGVGGATPPYSNRSLGAVYAYASTPGDQAWFYGSSGMDAFVASGSAYSYLSGTGFYNVAAGFGTVQAFSGSSQSIAYFLDSPGNDSFYGSAASCYMSGPGYINAAAGFALIYAQSFVGGTDYAYNLDPAHVLTAGFAGVFYP